MASDYISFDLRPGMVLSRPAYSAEGRWRKGSLVRWVDGQLAPVGGWAQYGEDRTVQPARSLMAWTDTDELPHLALGTADHLYLFDGALLNDITPSDLVPGQVDASIDIGYGAGLYGKGEYGGARVQSGLSTPATVWDLDTYGEFLIALSPPDGRVLLWKPSFHATDNAKVIDASAPTNNAGVVVTGDRFIMALGADGNARRVTWCSKGDYTQWVADETNSAGSVQIESQGIIMAGRAMLNEVLIFTDTDVHSMFNHGPPFYYGRQKLAEGCGLISRGAHMAVAGYCVWLSENGFFIYDGSVRPLSSTVWGSVKRALHKAQKSKITAGINQQFRELWWFLPTESTEPDLYIIWNYEDNWWAIGNLTRCAWAAGTVTDHPISTAPDGTIYLHEIGWKADGRSRVGDVYAVSAPFDMQQGERLLEASQLIPDAGPYDADALQYSFDLAYTPNGDEHTAGPYIASRNDGYIDVRFTGRQAALRIENRVDGFFHLGDTRLRIRAGGRR